MVLHLFLEIDFGIFEFISITQLWNIIEYFFEIFSWKFLKTFGNIFENIFKYFFENNFDQYDSEC